MEKEVSDGDRENLLIGGDAYTTQRPWVLVVHSTPDRRNVVSGSGKRTPVRTQTT